MDLITSLTDAEKWAYGIGITIIIGLLSIIGNHKLARRRERLSAIKNAAATFRTDVFSLLTGLYPEPVNWPADVDGTFRQIFPPLQRAIVQYRPHVPWWRRRAFDRAWFRYRCATGRKIDIQCYHHYMAFSDNPDPQGTFRRNIDALLAFARA